MTEHALILCREPGRHSTSASKTPEASNPFCSAPHDDAIIATTIKYLIFISLKFTQGVFQLIYCFEKFDVVDFLVLTGDVFGGDFVEIV